MPTGIFGELVRDWDRMSRLSATTVMVRSWGEGFPSLANIEVLSDLVDRIDHSPNDVKDAVLLDLIKLAQRGGNVAMQTIIIAMLPKLSSMAQTANMREGDSEERRQRVVCALIDVIAGYPVDRRPQRVAANMALDALHFVTRPSRQQVPLEVPSEFVHKDELLTRTECRDSDHTFEAVEGLLVDSPLSDGSLLEVLMWGVERGHISAEEASLLVQVYSPAPGEAGGHHVVAEAMGVLPATVRQRCSRATRKLASAVRASVDEMWTEQGHEHPGVTRSS